MIKREVKPIILKNLKLEYFFGYLLLYASE